MPLRSGRELKKIFNALCPFESDGRLKPEEDRVTLLASNSNIPIEIQMKAFVQAAAVEPGSPHMVGISQNCSMTTGNHPKNTALLKGVRRSKVTRPVAVGAARARRTLEEFTEDFGAELVFAFLDHFTAPPFDADLYSHSQRDSGMSRAMVRAQIEEAIEVMRPVYNEEINIGKEFRERYVNYLCSEVVAEYRKDFLGAVNLASPAWAMVDTGELPPILNFVLARGLVAAVRDELDNQDTMIEGEFSATGRSGKRGGYEKLTREALQHYKDRVVLFVKFTGVEGVTHDIGTKHAALQGEKYEADVERLEIVQRALFQDLGEYIPFAQHGGTGAAKLIRGLVAKNNFNTQYLADSARYFIDYYHKHREELIKGVKEVCGRNLYVSMVIPQARRAVSKLKEAGSFGLAPKLLKMLRET